MELIATLDLFFSWLNNHAPVIKIIVTSAFSPEAAGGGLAGAGILAAM